MRSIVSKLIIISLLLPSVGYAQSFKMVQQTTIPVIYGTDTLVNAWAGGLNAPQFSALDVNRDQIADLIVFDRSTNYLAVYVATQKGTTQYYRYTPTYASLFPSLQNWVLLADYDGDGKKDLFTSTQGGVKVYRNTTAGGNLSWAVASELLYTTGYVGAVNLYVSATDIPAIVDVDKDGDLDVLVADPTGHSVEFHQNRSREKYGHSQTLEFERASTCWGKFDIAEGCSGFMLNANCHDHTQGIAPKNGRIKHTGVSLLALDLDGNTTQDLLVSTVSCDKIAQLTNGGTTDQALVTSFQSQFPTSNPADLKAFSAAYYEDVDFDGKKDLLIAPNVSTNEGSRINFRQSAWRYQNTGTSDSPVFTFTQPDFLQNTMIDLGENTFPALADYDGDGDQDLVVGHLGNPADGQLQASLYLFKNIGDIRNPVFRLETDDYLGLASRRWTNLKPQFTDLNGDRMPDLVLVNTYNNGLNTDIKYWLNQAPRGQTFRFEVADARTLPLNLRAGDVPFLYDLDGDGDKDALLGRVFGELEYYQNTGTQANPAFTLANEAFGGLPLDVFDRSMAPLVADMDGNGKPELLTGDRNGSLRFFADITTDLNAAFRPIEEVIADSLSGTFMATKLGGTITLTAGDLTNDGLPDVVVGSGAGGLLVLKNNTNGGNPFPGPRPPNAKWLYPNPAHRFVYLNPPQEGEVVFFNAVGQRVGGTNRVPAGRETVIDLMGWPSGLYIARIRTASGVLVERIVVNK